MPRRRITLHGRSAAVVLALMGGSLSAPARGQSQQPTVSKVFGIDGAMISFVTLSPDRHWVVYSQYTSEQEIHLFARPATGGAATQLTPPGKTANGAPRFSPAGDRIVYTSTMPGSGHDGTVYGMTLPFDTRTGRATGAPRQVTLEPVAAGPLNGIAISPDGKWIAYVSCCDGRRLRVVPASGGNARTLAENHDPRVPLANLAWTDDGAAVMYVVAQPGGTSFRVMRAPITGGPAVEVRRATEPIGMLAPGGRMSAVVMPYGVNRRQRELRVRGADGAIVGRVRLPDNFDARLASWSADGRALVGVVRDMRALIRIASTTGAATRTLTSGADYEWPDGWSADSRTVYYETSPQGAPTLGAVTIDGERSATVESPKGGDYSSWGYIAGRYAVGSIGWTDSTRQHVIARSLDDGTTLTLTPAKYSPRALLLIRGAGGTYSVDGSAFLYYERVGEAMELRSIVPGERSRLLRTFRADRAGQMSVAVQNGRVIYSEQKGDSLRFLFSSSAATPPRQIAAVPAGDGAGEIAWTSDGRHVAFSGPGNSLYVLALGVDGTPMGTLQRYQLPFEYTYELSFLNDGRRLTMIAQPRGGPNAVVALVSLDDPSRPVILSEADGTSTWGHLMSPDGNWTAYSAELPPRGTTIYRIDLGAASQASAKR